MDRLILEGMVFSGRHGVLAAERELSARFTVDVEMSADLTRAAATDLLADSVDYSRAYGLVREVVEGEACQLLETLAGRIAERLLKLRGVQSVRVRVAKKPPLSGEFRSFAVELERSR